MRYRFNSLVCVFSPLFFLNLFFFFPVFLFAGSVQKRPFFVRVLLDEHKKPEKTEWTFFSEEGFILIEPDCAGKKIRCTEKRLTASFSDGFFYLNGKRFLKKRFIVFSKKGLLGFKENSYKGSFLVLLDEGDVARLINMVDLEDYIFAVLRSESWPGWPLEVNKVFAVATRTYVIAKVCEARASKKTFHIKNTRIHQMYNGHTFQIRNSKILQQAVDETRGQFLTYDDKPIVAMFDSCCGGIIPSKVEGVNFEKAPYLARDYPCQHCERCRLSRWNVEYDIDEWTRILQKHFPELKKVRGIKVIKRDGAGLIQEIEIKGVKQTFSLTGKKLYSLLDAVKSFFFTVHKKGKKILLKGRGYGHHLGLCQWGAREMVRDEWSYKQILQFYYPDVLFARLA